ACEIDDDVRVMALTGPPPGIISVGGYRFVMRNLQDAVSAAAGDGTLTALPDALAGHRLAGSAGDRAAMQATLAESGANPLLVGAFRDRKRPDEGRRKTEAG